MPVAIVASTAAVEASVRYTRCSDKATRSGRASGVRTQRLSLSLEVQVPEQRHCCAAEDDLTRAHTTVHKNRRPFELVSGKLLLVLKWLRGVKGPASMTTVPGQL